MPSDLTSEQAITAAHELRNGFDQHVDLLSWRAQRLREPWRDPQIEALNIHPNVKDIVPYQSDVANQEAHRYANAFTTADPELAVFVRSEKKTEQDIGARLEQVYDAALAALWPDPYQAALYVAGEGFCPLRLDLKPEFWKGIPKRGDMEAEQFNDKVDGHRRALALPFELVTLDPSTFFYDENKQREITIGVEWGRRKQTAVTEAYKGKAREEFLGPTVPENVRAGTRMVTFVVVRTPQQIFHIQLAGGEGGTKSSADKVLWEGPNLFAPGTGYVLWRGLYSGDANLGRRYHPFILNTLNVQEHLNLFLSLQANLAVQEQSFWEERAGQPHDNIPARGITAEAKGAKGGAKSDSRAVATMEEGVVVRWRDMHNRIENVIARLEVEEERYAFPEPLAPESSQGSSGRDTIRRQEASARLLRQGFVGRQIAIKEILGVIIHTIFTHKPFLAQGRMIFVPLLEEGLGDEGTTRKQEMLFIEAGDDIPHELRVEVATSSQAADAAMREEGTRMEGRLSRDTIDQDFYKVVNLGQENRRRAKDAIRQATYQVALTRGIEEANARLLGRVPPGSPVVAPAEGQPTNGTKPAVDPAASGRPTPSEPEDLGIQGGGGPAPAPVA